jgi:hypothetical protein
MNLIASPQIPRSNGVIYMKIVFLLISIFNVGLAFAGENLRWKRTGSNQLEIVVLHGDGAVFHLERFQVANEGWQDRVSHRSFSNLDMAQTEFQRITKDFQSGPLPATLLKQDIGSSRGKIWESRRSWDQNWEVKFGQWMSETASATFLTKYKVATDCADAALAFRWIFSRIHGLPAAAFLGGSGSLFSNHSLRRDWENLPTHRQWHRDQRFLTALNYLMENAYTHSLMKDLYPVKIDQWGVSPGTVFLHLYSEESGHTEIFHRVGRDVPGAIRVLASTVPRRVQDLSEYAVMDWGDYPQKSRSGLFRFRWPVVNGDRVSMLPPDRMPMFSEEQYSAGFGIGYEHFIDAVIKKTIRNYNPDHRSMLRSRAIEINDRLRQRVRIVNDGSAFCAANDCSEGSPGWEAWSTPSRDSAIQRVIGDAMEIYDSDDCPSACQQELDSRYGQLITTVNGKAVSLGSAIEAIQEGRISSDPRDNPASRWGL